MALGVATGAAAALGGCAFEEPVRARPITKAQISYGLDPLQSGVLRSAKQVSQQHVVVLLHGGYWRTGWDRSAMEPLAEDLARRGWATWNIGYRRVGDPGGGWPGTLEDVAAGIDHLATLQAEHDLDLSKVTVIGHSAGAQLAFWAAARKHLGAGAPGGAPAVSPAAAISLSGVLDLAAAAQVTAFDGGELAASTQALLGGAPDQVPDRYQMASPIDLVPLAVPQLLLHGSGDAKVPADQSRLYGERAGQVGDAIAFVELPDVNHFDVILLDRVWWSEVLRWLPEALGSPP